MSGYDFTPAILAFAALCALAGVTVFLVVSWVIQHVAIVIH